MQDDPPQDAMDESHGETRDVDDNDATEISEAETEKPNTSEADSNGVEETPQSLVLGDSLAGEIESIVASDISIDERLASAVIETDESESISAKNTEAVLPGDASGILKMEYDEEGHLFPDVGSLSREAGGPYLGEFLNDVEDDPDAATMLETANDFDLDAELENDIEDAMHPNANEFDLNPENPSHSCMWSSSFDFTSDWRLCLSEILYCYRLYASFAFYTAMFFICFGALINNYLQILNNKRSLLVVLIWMASFWLACLCCNFINFARRRRWYKKQEFESSDMLDVSSLSDSMAPAPYTDGQGRKRLWYYKEQLSDSEIFLPKRISLTTTLFVASCTAVLAVTSYQMNISFGTL